MKALDLESKCWKCGGEEVTLSFIRRVRPGDWAWPQVLDESVMRRRCVRCHHEWNEKPLSRGAAPSDGGEK